MLKKIIRLLKTSPFFIPVLFLVDLLLYCIDRFAAFGSVKTNSGSICIVKLDKLGDYILIRNFLHDLIKSEKHKDHRFTFIGNIENKMFVDYLDPDLFNDILWINIYKYSTHPIYRFKMSRKIHRKGFETSIAPTFARVLVLDDFVSLTTGAKKRIGQKAHLINIKKWELYFGNRCYTDLIQTSKEVVFEFERNRIFFEKLTKRNLTHVPLQINIAHSEIRSSTTYAVILPGAADKFREWSALNFAKVADFLVAEKGMSIVLCGSPAENGIGEEIKKLSVHTEKIKNEIGRLNMRDLFNVFSNAALIVSNETGAIHINGALGKPVYCISNGNHFKKYTEYPEKLKTNLHYIYPQYIEENINETDRLAKEFDLKSNLDINSISPNKVIDCINKNI